MAQLYFTDSTIVGVDVDAAVIDAAKTQVQRLDVRSNQVEFYLDDDRSDWVRPSYFDCIFAMSVLCLWPQTKDVDNIGEIFPFARFESTINILDRSLKPGGYLVVYNSNYRFEDAEASRNYEPITNVTAFPPGKVTTFEPDGTASQKSSAAIFRKRERCMDRIHRLLRSCD